MSKNALFDYPFKYTNAQQDLFHTYWDFTRKYVSWKRCSKILEPLRKAKRDSQIKEVLRRVLSTNTFSKHFYQQGKSQNEQTNYTFCCSLAENILSLTPTSNSLIQKYIHFMQSTFNSVDTQPFASKGIP